MIENENISISLLKEAAHSNEYIVSSRVLLKSNIETARTQLADYANALNMIKCNDEKHQIEIKKEFGLHYKHIKAIVNQKEYLTLSFHPQLGWYVGENTALPTDISLSKAVVNAMSQAFCEMDNIS